MTDPYENIRLALEMGPTPGPWQISTENQTIIKQDMSLIGLPNGGVLIGSACGHESSGFFPTTDQAAANARLIAACDPDTVRALLDERDQLAAALEAAREDAWQPIETCPNESRVVMFCDERQNIWTDCAWDRSDAATGFYATHWRPLPAPPAIDQARGKEAKT